MRNCTACNGTGKPNENPYKRYSLEQLEWMEETGTVDYGALELPRDYDGPNHDW